MRQRINVLTVVLAVAFLFGITGMTEPTSAPTTSNPKALDCIEERDVIRELGKRLKQGEIVVGDNISVTPDETAADSEELGIHIESIIAAEVGRQIVVGEERVRATNEDCPTPEIDPDNVEPGDFELDPGHFEDLLDGLEEIQRENEEERLREAAVCASLGVTISVNKFGQTTQMNCSVRPEVTAERDKILAVLERGGRDSTQPDGRMRRNDQVSIANDLADALGSRPDLVDFMVARSSGNFWINPIPGEVAGYARCRNATYLNKRDGYIMIEPGSDQFVIAHEAAHILDCEGGRGRLNGTPNALSGTDLQTFLSERARLSQDYKKDPSLVVPLREYSFGNNKEFWADASGLFLSYPHYRTQMAETAPLLHDVLRDYYNRQDLPDAASLKATTTTHTVEIAKAPKGEAVVPKASEPTYTAPRPPEPKYAAPKAPDISAG